MQNPTSGDQNNTRKKLRVKLPRGTRGHLNRRPHSRHTRQHRTTPARIHSTDMAKCAPNFVSRELIALCKEKKVKLPDGTKVKVGDVVICSSTGNWEDPDVIGKCVFACPKGCVFVKSVFIFVFFACSFGHIPYFLYLCRNPVKL